MALLTTATVKLELARAKEILEKTNQPKILEFLTKCQDPEKIDRVLIQLATFEREYPGGLENYIAKITKLLKEYVENVTKYDGCELKAPATFHLSWEDDLNAVRQTDLKGIPHLKKCAFFLLAGGLGERMGFDGAKPCKQEPEEVTLPFVVMTIPETQKSIRKQLEEHNHFGLKPEQFYFLNQYQVPAVLNMNGEIDFDSETATIHCKPHGHGECHLLMHKSGLARKFKEQGFEWITFFNDTNPLSFRFLPSYLGIASEHDWETTYVCVKRKPGEAVGAVCEVDLPDRTIITNVEYNVLEKLGKTKPEPTDAEGYSKLPGNVNFIIISLKTYSEALERSSGFVPEFINPKFQADGHTLKSPTRMETLISEYTYLLPDSKRVGAIQCDRLMCFTSAKNEIELGLQRQSKNLSTETCGACQFEFLVILLIKPQRWLQYHTT